ncbi:hypothetical protein HU200_036608 [Digitaria exilis]|uniref:OVATE domain-containing protein n=2 Tax=PACMAD clade TaxID=147370 RepID=A0A835BQ53_9POAL|nr:hypothetical protein HU200_036608 [Digitaria exilis]
MPRGPQGMCSLVWSSVAAGLDRQAGAKRPEWTASEPGGMNLAGGRARAWPPLPSRPPSGASREVNGATPADTATRHAAAGHRREDRSTYRGAAGSLLTRHRTVPLFGRLRLFSAPADVAALCLRSPDQRACSPTMIVLVRHGRRQEAYASLSVSEHEPVRDTKDKTHVSAAHSRQTQHSSRARLPVPATAMHTPFMDKLQSPHRRRDTTGGRLKQRLAQILTRSSCTTNTTTSSAANPNTAFVSLATRADESPYQEEAPPSPYFCTPCTYERPTTKVVDGARIPHRRRRTRSASLVHISFDCTGGGASGRRSVQSDAPLLHHLSVPARDVVINKQQSKGKPAARRSPSASRRHLSSSSSSSWGRARRPRTRRTTAAPYSWSSSSSSTATDDEVAPFSSDEGEGDDGEEAETRTLFSSLSFSSDSSEFYRRNNTRNNTSHRRRTTATARRALPRTAGGEPGGAPGDGAFRPVVASVETARKQHRECSERKKEERGVVNAKKPLMGGAAAAEEASAGTAVVKRSSNPYLDFRSSMVEMVVERRIGSVGQMEELLGSYLSLNSPRHHPAILAAFEDVWEAVFGEE